MGAFLSGLLGKMGQLQEQKEQRTYEEKKAERDRMRKLVEYAGEEAIRKGDIEALPAIMGELDELGEIPGAQSESPFADFGKRLGGLIHRRKQQQQQQAQAQKADQQYQQITGQPPPGSTALVTPPMPPTQFGQPGAGMDPGIQAVPNITPEQAAATRASAGGMTATPQVTPDQAAALRRSAAGFGVMPGQMAQAQPTNVTPPMPALPGWVQRYRQAQELGKQRELAAKEQEFQTGRTHENITAGDEEKRLEAKADALTKYFQSRGLDEKTAREEADKVVFPQLAGKLHNLSTMLYKVPGSEELHSGLYDLHTPGRVFDASTGQALEPGTFTVVDKTVAGIEARGKYWGMYGNFLRANLGQGMSEADAARRAGAEVDAWYRQQVQRRGQQIDIDAELSGIKGNVPPEFQRIVALGQQTGKPSQTVQPSQGQPRTVTQPIPPPRKPVAQAMPGGPLGNLSPQSRDDVLYYLGTLTGTQKGASKAAQVRGQRGLRAIAQATGMDPMTLTARLTETPALAKQIAETVQRAGAIQRLNNTIEVHGRVLNEVMKHQTDTGSPLLNRPVREWGRLAVGSPDYKRLVVALNELQREYAYLTAGGAQSRAMLPVHTSESMDKILSPDSTLPEIVAAVDQIGVGARTELQAMNKTVQDLQQQMLGGPAGQATGASQTPPPGNVSRGTQPPPKTADEYLKSIGINR